MANYCWVYVVIHFTSPAGWLPVHRDQLRAQRSVTSTGRLYLFYHPMYTGSVNNWLNLRRGWNKTATCNGVTEAERLHDNDFFKQYLFIYFVFANTGNKNIVRTSNCRTNRQNNCTYGSPLKHNITYSFNHNCQTAEVHRVKHYLGLAIKKLMNILIQNSSGKITVC